MYFPLGVVGFFSSPFVRVKIPNPAKAIRAIVGIAGFTSAATGGIAFAIVTFLPASSAFSLAMLAAASA